MPAVKNTTSINGQNTTFLKSRNSKNFDKLYYVKSTLYLAARTGCENRRFAQFSVFVNAEAQERCDNCVQRPHPTRVRGG